MHTPLGAPVPRRVAVAMSGGLDSSATLALLQAQGHATMGVTMRLWREPGQEGDPADADIASARGVCRQLGVAHHVVDLREAFYAHVVCYLVDAYTAGRTPNPCIRCNRQIKFGLLLEQALALGADAMATGHYARIAHERGRYRLLRGRDAAKDQAYFLYTLGQESLARLLFPLGEWTKSDVRAYAREQGLPLTERPESQDLCFLQDGDYRRLIATQRPEAVRPGPIYNRAGELLGEHRGLPNYTIGQRSGLGIAAPRPLYVLALDAGRNALVVGHAEELGRRALLARDVTTVSGQPLPPGAQVQAKIRYRARAAAATVHPQGEGAAWVRFAAPLRDITPGQAVVFYRGDEVLGGGLIARAEEPCGSPRAR
jgi:tRNA-uridine 2-sulfurtransferase